VELPDVCLEVDPLITLTPFNVFGMTHHVENFFAVSRSLPHA